MGIIVMYKTMQSVQRSTEDLPVMYLYATCVLPSRRKCVQTPAHTGHNNPVYISQLALGSLTTSWKIIP